MFIRMTFTDEFIKKTQIKIWTFVVVIILGLNLSAFAQNDSFVKSYMPNAKIILYSNTGSTINVNNVASLYNGSVNNGVAVWSKSLNTFQSGGYWSSFPNVTIRFALTSTGEFYIGVEGSDSDVLSVFTEGGINDGMSATWGYPMTDQSEILHGLLDKDIRSSLLTNIMYDELMSIDQKGYATGGPKLVYAKPYGESTGKTLLGFTDLSFSLDNRLGNTITVLTSALFESQSTTQWACGCAVDGIAFKDGPIWPMYNALNHKWNPKKADTDVGGTERSFDLSISNQNAIFFTARANGDNGNSGSVDLDGKQVSSFSNCCTNSAYRKGGETFGTVDLKLENDWSQSYSYLRLAILGGSLSYSNLKESPTGGMSGNPDPIVYKVDKGWTTVSGTSNSQGGSTTNTWPEISKPAIRFKIISNKSLAIASVTVKINPILDIGGTPNEMHLKENNDGSYFAYFDSSDLNTISKGVVGGDIINGIFIKDNNSNLVGHIPFHYTYKDHEIGKNIDAVLYIQSDLNNDKANYPHWKYYSSDSEKPVSMLIPPKGSIDSITSSKPPILLVHGVSGEYPYWGQDLLDQLNTKYNVWQFYYPYDQEIELSAKLLARAIPKILKPTDFVGSDPYKNVNSIPVITHSMGGLVARYYIENFYNNNISRLLMLAPPNHGSYSTFNLRFGFFDNQLRTALTSIFGGFDPNAPAYQEMMIGSTFLDKLNYNNNIIPLEYSNDLSKDYLVISGVKDLYKGPLLINDEVNNQDDGVVSVSSASMMNSGIPLAVINMTHIEFPNQSGSYIEDFLENLYKNFGSSDFKNNHIIAYYDLNNAQKYDNRSFNDQAGILRVVIPNVNLNRCKVEVDGDRGKIKLFYDDTFSKDFIRSLVTHLFNPLYAPKESSSFSKNFNNEYSYYFTTGVSGHRAELYNRDLTFDYPDKKYTIKPVYNKIPSGSGTNNITTYIPGNPETIELKPIGSFDFKSMQMNKAMTNFDNSEYKLWITGGSNSVPARKVLAKTNVTQTNVETYSINVDKFVNPLVIFVSTNQKPSQLDPVLKTPSGIIVDSTYTSNNNGYYYGSYSQGGYAYYYIENPPSGQWQISYTPVDKTESVFVPIKSSFDLYTIITDTTYSLNNPIHFGLNISDFQNCSNVAINTSYYFAPTDSTSSSLLGTIGLYNSQIDTLAYKGKFTPSNAGIYYLVTNFSCDYEGSHIERQSLATIHVKNIDTGISQRESNKAIPNKYLLHQNYPNPFNPTTQISFDLPKASFVKLAVYDILGRQVAVLVDRHMSEGAHNVTFNAYNLSSGLYIYRLKVGNYTETKKMMLIK